MKDSTEYRASRRNAARASAKAGGKKFRAVWEPSAGKPKYLGHLTAAASSKYAPHNGAQEMARRALQITA